MSTLWEHLHGKGCFFYGRIIYSDSVSYEKAKSLLVSEGFVFDDGTWFGRISAQIDELTVQVSFETRPSPAFPANSPKTDRKPESPF